MNIKTQILSTFTKPGFRPEKLLFSKDMEDEAPDIERETDDDEEEEDRNSYRNVDQDDMYYLI